MVEYLASNQRTRSSILPTRTLTLNSVGVKSILVYNTLKGVLYMKKKYCGGCDRTLLVSAFAKNKAKKDGLQTRCRECKKKHDADYYQRNKLYYLKYNKQQYQARLQEINNYKQAQGCACCPENDPCCLDFHHPDGATKEKDVSRLVADSGKKRIWSEIAKCVVVCANCHRKIHAKKIQAPWCNGNIARS